MKLYRLHFRQYLPIGIDTAWTFFLDPRNLAQITPPWLRFRVTSQLPEKMYVGLIIMYKISPILNIPLSWVTEITHMVEPHLFVDEQRFGPYRFWHHQHLFRETDDGIEIQDIIHYALYMGPIGRLLHRWVVGPKLWDIFNFRRQALEQRFKRV
ncbi:MAG TPA: SRPBCC family protein [Candidatus Limnocylindrales bacterium]|nr:SRPBCC family protein [Candidatus Limnocylindrales bacterium]